MIAADTSTWIAFFQNEDGPDVQILDRALADRVLLMVPAVLSELLSDPKLPEPHRSALLGLPLIDIEPGFWSRAGDLRASLVAKRRKARLGDTLIAQACLDRGVPLVARDSDFRAIAELGGLELL